MSMPPAVLHTRGRKGGRVKRDRHTHSHKHKLTQTCPRNLHTSAHTHSLLTHRPPSAHTTYTRPHTHTAYSHTDPPSAHTTYTRPHTHTHTHTHTHLNAVAPVTFHTAPPRWPSTPLLILRVHWSGGKTQHSHHLSSVQTVCHTLAHMHAYTRAHM